jgi:uncharacterized protein (TIGR03000 family)
MLLQRLPFASTAAGVMMALAFTVAPAYAARGGGGGGGGGHGGGGYHGGGGGYYGGGGYGGYGRGGYGGYGRGGYGYGDGFYGGLGLGYGLGYYGGGYDYPNYGTTYSGYFNPDVQYAQPTLNVSPSANYDGGAPEAGYSARPDGRAHIVVEVPNPDTQVFFDGDETRQKGSERAFVTPALLPGHTYHYTIEAKWMENGKQMNKTRTITVNPGGSATVVF